MKLRITTLTTEKMKSFKKGKGRNNYSTPSASTTSGSTNSISSTEQHNKAVQVFGQVQGEIPSWLEGSLVRHDSGTVNTTNGNGSERSLYKSNISVQKESQKNVATVGKQSIHRFTISDGKVSLEQHTLERSWNKQRRRSSISNQSIIKDFGSSDFDQSPPYSSTFEKIMVKLEQVFLNSQTNLCDSCNSNICYFGEQMYVVTESSPTIQRIDPSSLKVVENITISDVIPAVSSFTAHPHVLEDGSVLNIGNSTVTQNKSHYHVIHTPPGRGSEESVLKDSIILATIPSRSKFHQSYYHSFGLTGDKLIFIEQPLRLSMPQTLWSRLRGKPLSTSALKWYSNEKTQIFVVSLSNGEVGSVTYWTDKLFAFHHVNTYEENGCIIMDVIGYDSGQFVSDMAKERLSGSKNSKQLAAKSFSPTARRYILPLNIPKGCLSGTNLLEDSFPTTAQAIFQHSNSIQCIPEYLYNQTFELPRINSLKNGHKYNYVYGVSSSESFKKSSLPNTIVKLNVSTSESVSWNEDGKVCVCEPVYVPNPMSACEDDGVLLVTLINYENIEHVTLLILDAQIMAEIARVTFVTDEPISETSHGPWVPFQSGNLLL